MVVFTVRKRVTLMRLCCAAVLLLPLVRIFCIRYGSDAFVDDGALHNFTLLRLDEFLFGGFLALGLRGPAARRIRAAGPYFFFGALLVLGACRLYAPLFRPGEADLLLRNRWILSVGITVVDALAAGMILLCLDARSWFARVMNLAPLRALGKISYGFYVFHDIPHVIYNHLEGRLHLDSHGLGLFVPLLGTLLLSVLSYNLLERPFLRLKTRFETERPPVSTIQTAV